MMPLPTVHGDKLHALLANPKLPAEDVSLVEQTLDQYQHWRAQSLAVTGNTRQKIEQLVELLNTYKHYLDLTLIFDSTQNFLYRQKGQLKLDNTVIEEFLPLIATRLFDDALAQHTLHVGPATCFSSVYFSSSPTTPQAGGGLKLRQKAQDFVISKPLYLSASHNTDLSDAVLHHTQVAYLAIECKTNLDKTMFQEAAATALDLKTSVPTAKYYLLCEWLDMAPISSSTTAIDEVLILRRAKRIPAHIRGQFSTVEGRKHLRESYAAYLQDNAFSVEVFARIVAHMGRLLNSDAEDDVLRRGHF